MPTTPAATSGSVTMKLIVDVATDIATAAESIK